LRWRLPGYKALDEDIAMHRSTVRLPCIALLVGAALAAAAAPFPRSDSIKTELERLAGTWRPTSLQGPEGEGSLEDLKKEDYRLIFKGSRLTIATKDDVTEAVITIDPAKRPMTIDIVIQRKDKIKQTKYLGIYKLDKDTLTICHNVDSSPRPESFRFTSKEANRFLTGLMVLKREIPRKK
jgi:uncharacterized protein (TIGR03067 family)